jgi:hypothetical protein
VSVNTGGITSFSAGVDGDGTVGAGTGVSVVNKRIAIVSGDVRVPDGVVSVQAGGDTSVPVWVDEGDTVVMNTGRGNATTVGVVSGSVVTPAVDLLVVMLVLFLLMRVGILVFLCALTGML